jgi:carbon storage regulator CsrA
MLVTSRHINERIVLTIPPGFSGRIELLVIDLQTDGQSHRRKVKLGIDAPKEVQINRHEVQELIDAKGGDYGTT